MNELTFMQCNAMQTEHISVIAQKVLRKILIKRHAFKVAMPCMPAIEGKLLVHSWWRNTTLDGLRPPESRHAYICKDGCGPEPFLILGGEGLKESC